MENSEYIGQQLQQYNKLETQKPISSDNISDMILKGGSSNNLNDWRFYVFNNYNNIRIRITLI